MWVILLLVELTSSPRPWRCFLLLEFGRSFGVVFSTSVEVFLRAPLVDEPGRGLLHVRGGVSCQFRSGYIRNRSSPRPWRCFQKKPGTHTRARVFSTSVEVFLIPCVEALLAGCLLHVRGGVSIPSTSLALSIRSSPRPWRCFHECRNAIRKSPVFSTSVEVFLCACCRRSSRMRLLHVRGGVSDMKALARDACRSSPRPWRCFYLMNPSDIFFLVFSTSVEVFPRMSAMYCARSSLLHVRGGVSDQSP